jgi:ribosomal protein L44E
MTTRPEATGPKSENPYCSRCGKHLAIAFHETNEHDDAKARAELHARFDEITKGEGNAR